MPPTQGAARAKLNATIHNLSHPAGDGGAGGDGDGDGGHVQALRGESSAEPWGSRGDLGETVGTVGTGGDRRGDRRKKRGDRGDRGEREGGGGPSSFLTVPTVPTFFTTVPTPVPTGPHGPHVFYRVRRIWGPMETPQGRPGTPRGRRRPPGDAPGSSSFLSIFPPSPIPPFPSSSIAVLVQARRIAWHFSCPHRHNARQCITAPQHASHDSGALQRIITPATPAREESAPPSHPMAKLR